MCRLLQVHCVELHTITGANILCIRVSVPDLRRQELSYKTTFLRVFYFLDYCTLYTNAIRWISVLSNLPPTPLCSERYLCPEKNDGYFNFIATLRYTYIINLVNKL